MSDVYYDLHMEGDEPEEKSGLSKVLSIVYKTVSVLLVLTVFFLLFYRMWEMKEPSGTGSYIWTAATQQAQKDLAGKTTTVSKAYAGGDYSYEYESLHTVTLTQKTGEGEDEDYERFVVPKSEYYGTQGFEIYTQELVSYRSENDEGESEVVERSPYYSLKGSPVEGALSVSHLYYVPSAKQVQLTFRYKNDVTEKLESTLWQDTGLPFDFVLTDDVNDYGTFSYKTFKKGVYRYITMVFEGVDLSSVQQLNLELGYVNLKNESVTLNMCVYDSNLPVEPVQVKSGEVMTLPQKAQ
ncbi:MAG: hypothetical protein IJ344_01370 [Clostridia bacterium]|nr:hypothetical protein [Clostridia bacterium]